MVLTGSGVVFAGVMAFMCSGLVVPPLVRVNASCCGCRRFALSPAGRGATSRLHAGAISVGRANDGGHWNHRLQNPSRGQFNSRRIMSRGRVVLPCARSCWDCSLWLWSRCAPSTREGLRWFPGHALGTQPGRAATGRDGGGPGVVGCTRNAHCGLPLVQRHAGHFDRDELIAAERGFAVWRESRAPRWLGWIVADRVRDLARPVPSHDGPGGGDGGRTCPPPDGAAGPAGLVVEGSLRPHATLDQVLGAAITVCRSDVTECLLVAAAQMCESRRVRWILPRSEVSLGPRPIWGVARVRRERNGSSPGTPGVSARAVLRQGRPATWRAPWVGLRPRPHAVWVRLCTADAAAGR